MTTIQITLPDTLAERAKRAGLLSQARVESLFEQALARDETRERFLAHLDEVRAKSGEPMSLEGIQEVVREVRRERRAAGR